MDNYLIQLTLIIMLGSAAQMLAWRLKLPSILLLLAFGFAAGPVFGVIKPDALFGDLLFPVVSISVAVILFEGGLSLRVPEMKSVGRVVVAMITIGIIVTWIMTTAAAYYILHFDLSLSLLIGAILVVTGPTVIIPLLRHIRPAGEVNSILKWEGMLNDAAGALLAVLVLEGILSAGLQEATANALIGILKTIILGGSLGFFSAYLIVIMLKREIIPGFLQNAAVLTSVILIFTVSQLIQSESGLFAVTVMGMVLANQKSVAVKHIIEFKEHLRVLLISILFIVLAARFQVKSLETIGINSFLFLAALIFLIRPVAVFLSTLGAGLGWKERLFIGGVAPRGIVAAAVSSLFSLELLHAGYPQADSLVAIIFLVIIGTILFYGLTALPLAKWLNIAQPNPQGILLIGAHEFARMLGKTIRDNGYRVLLIDTNWENISAARLNGLETFYGSVLSESILDELNFDGIGYMLALTANEEVNSLAALYFARIFGNENVYQLAVGEKENRQGEHVSKELRGKILFNWNVTFQHLSDRIINGHIIKSTPITDSFDHAAFREKYRGRDILPLMIKENGNQLSIVTKDEDLKLKSGQAVISLAPSD